MSVAEYRKAFAEVSSLEEFTKLVNKFDIDPDVSDVEALEMFFDGELTDWMLELV